MSQEIQEQLHKQQEVIADKQMSVKEDLDKVEPAVIEAQNGMLAPQEITPVVLDLKLVYGNVFPCGLVLSNRSVGS